MLETSTRRTATWLLLLWKKWQRKVRCISGWLEIYLYANVVDPISMTTVEPFELKAKMRNLSSHTLSLKVTQL